MSLTRKRQHQHSALYFYLSKYPEMIKDFELRNPWQSMKTQRTMSMTVEAWEVLGKLATQANTSRSDVLEVLIRNAFNQELDLEEEKHFLINP